MGRKRRTDKVDRTIRGRKIGTRHRVDISTIEDRVRRDEIISFANRIQALAGLQVQDEPLPAHLLHEATSQLSMGDDEVIRHINHFIAYHEKYPGEHPANAFTPIDRKERTSNENGSAASDDPPPKQKLIRRRPHINSITDTHLREQYIIEANEYQRLNEEEDLYKRLLPGSLAAAAKKLGVTRDWVEKKRKHLREYHQDYPDDPLGTSVVPLPRGPQQQGRLNGGKTSTDAEAQRSEIIRNIEDAYTNRQWYSRKGDANHRTEQYTQIQDTLIGPRLIYELIKKKYGDIVSESTVWRIIDDFRRRNPTRVHAAREDINDARQNFFPFTDNDVSGSSERIQIDIRPLPIRVQLEGMVDTTVYVAWIIDDFSRAVLEYEIITRKTFGPDKQIERQDFTCKQIRILIARFIIKTGKRPRIIYVDEGTQFAEALARYMSFLKAPGEDVTVLRHRRGARGGGKAERSLQMIDRFLETQRGYVRGSNYRRSYERTKPRDLSTFEDFKTNFATFVHHWNNDLAPDGGPSRWQVWDGGPDKGLSPPPNFHLIAFASGERHETREWDGGFFKIDNQRWFPAEPSVGLYEKLADAKKREEEIPIIVSVLDNETFVFFRLEGGTEWHEAIRKGTKRQSDRKHQNLLNTLEHDISNDNRRRAADFFDRTIRGDGSKPLVLDGLSRERRFVYLDETLPPEQRSSSQQHTNTMPRGDLERQAAADSDLQPQRTTPPPAAAAADSDPQTTETAVQAGDTDKKAPTTGDQNRKIGFISRRLAEKKE